MRTLVALVETVVMLSGWSGAEAAEARITSFRFSCETPEGRKLKPKFGDVDGVFYTDLPAQRQQCLDAVKRKISLCRENTSFESNTKDEKYAACLPIFREQAKGCVAHFERERGKCDGGGRKSARAVSLDPGERRRVQAALADAGFDPGPADGKFGPRTRRAIQGWQQANGYATTGELTKHQAEALLTETPPTVALRPKCTELPRPDPGEPVPACWDAIENRPGCYWLSYRNRSDQAATWSGRCRGGIADGPGTLSISAGSAHGPYEGTGTLSSGKENGRWTGYGSVPAASKASTATASGTAMGLTPGQTATATRASIATATYTAMGLGPCQTATASRASIAKESRTGTGLSPGPPAAVSRASGAMGASESGTVHGPPYLRPPPPAGSSSLSKGTPGRGPWSCAGVPGCGVPEHRVAF